MQWEKDLESLVAETRAMVRRANQKTAERAAIPVVLDPVVFEAPLPPAPPPPAPPPPEPIVKSSVPNPPRVTTWASPAREEIMQRVAGFRALQEKMRRDRENYYLEMVAKTRAMLRDGGQNQN